MQITFGLVDPEWSTQVYGICKYFYHSLNAASTISSSYTLQLSTAELNNSYGFRALQGNALMMS